MSLVFFSCPLVVLAQAPERSPPQRLQLDAGTSESLSFSSLSDATSSDAKTVRVRQVDAQTLVLTARKVGVATVRVWEHGGTETVYQVHVVPSGRLAVAQGPDLGVVRVRLQILEVSDRARQELGVHWPQMIDFQAQGRIRIDDQTMDLGMRFGSAQGWLRQLLEKGWAKLLSQPDLSVALGEEARFVSGGEVPFAVLTDSYGRLQQSIQWKPYGLSLRIRPESTDGFLIRSEVYVDISDLAPISPGQTVPAVARRTVSTKVNSREGETIFLSGLIRQTQSAGKGAVPLLSEIPIFGILFQERSNAQENSEVVVAMTLGLNTRKQIQEQQERFEKMKAQEAP